MLKWICLTMLVLLSACTQPIVMIPGGKLTGEVTAVPKTWVSVPGVVQFETRPSDPYSVNIWALVDHGNLYLATKDAKWVPFIANNDQVRVKVEGSIFELQADLVTDETELMNIAKAYEKKYEVDPDDNWVKDAQAYRLRQR